MAKTYISYEWLRSNLNKAAVAEWAPTNNSNGRIRTTTYCTDTDDLICSASDGATVYVAYQLFLHGGATERIA